MAALDNQSPIWKNLPEVSAVTVFPATEECRLSITDFEGDPPLLIPVMEKHIISRPSGFRELSPDADVVELLADKKKFANYVEQAGLSYFAPATYASTVDIRFPCVIKRTNLNAGNGIECVRDLEHLAEILTRKTWDKHDYILQEFLAEATDYATYCVCKNGRILWHCSFAYAIDSAYPIRGSVQGGTPQIAHSFTPDNHILAQMEAFLQPLNFNGPCNIDYKIGADGRIRVLEINPRLGGSLMNPAHYHHLEALLRCIILNATLAPSDQMAA
jgi:carbamoylphosphate synthase large subunit